MTDSPTATCVPPTSFGLRDRLLDLVFRDLHGPAGGDHEELSKDERTVRERYLVGAVAPKGRLLQPESHDGVAIAGKDSEDGEADDAAPSQNTFFPNAIGFSFNVSEAASGLVFEATWGKYSKEESGTQIGKGGNPAKAWQRQPKGGLTLPVPLRRGVFGPLVPDATEPEVAIQGRMRQRNGTWIVTAFLVNSQQEPEQNRDVAWLFQAALKVRSVDGAAVLLKRMPTRVPSSAVDSVTREEREAMSMLYRHHVEFAVGHGVATQVELSADPTRATAISTCVMPRTTVRQQVAPNAFENAALSGLETDMKRLAEMPRPELLGALRVLTSAYAQWIVAEEAKLVEPGARLADHAAAARRATSRCRATLGRLEAGIALLESDDVALESFRFANRAMAIQRVRSILVRRVRKGQMKPGDDPSSLDEPRNRSWRPFQLAFVLINLPGLTQLDHPERSAGPEGLADLLWFPTGGGKTEAYLGLTAYTLALRRLGGVVEGRSGEHGVAVLMRYTLRLLTLQQFQRATALICACEALRREDPARWGQAPFRIGLWVGSKATPNTVAMSEESVLEIRSGGFASGGKGSPHQLTVCPWCGTPIDGKRHIEVRRGPGTMNRTLIWCGDELGRCPFTPSRAPDEGLPVLVVDEEIYRHPPALLIATVDKFAQMPWKGEVQTLFGQVNGLCPRHGFLCPSVEDAQSHPASGALPKTKNLPHGPLRPPDLIIQDELHLISGPLGSMVGLYETAVDELCTWTVGNRLVRPKVIASTATIRRAEEQVRNLFQRGLHVFPPHGTDITDNFFSVVRPPSPETPGRTYLGICAFGRRFPVALIRVYTAFLAAAEVLYRQNDAVADPWMTLVGYFNSIRELAGMRRLVEDDVRTRLRKMEERGLARRDLRLGAVEELTSRKSGTEIPSLLDRLEVPFSQASEAARKGATPEQKRKMPVPFDVVLATNMISVGVDVDRLGLMLVAGQPKTTAEYIQATSRVGRAHPGIVCTLYNWARPRDLSHYESFANYHETFYQHVEALSVTPWAPRALDRGLSGVMVALARLKESRLNHNRSAGQIQSPESILREVSEAVRLRAERIAGGKAAAETKQLLEERERVWQRQAVASPERQLAYQREPGNVVPLLSRAGAGPWDTFTCLNSLRDVEANVPLLLKPADGLSPMDQTGGVP